MKTLFLELALRFRVLWNAFLVLLGFRNEITPVGRLYAVHKRGGVVVQDLGLISTKVVTDAGVAYLVDAMQGSVEPEVLRFHGTGTGTTAEAASQTALVTETGSRVSGTLTEGTTANIFRTVATVPYTSTLAITEHGIFSASSAGTMLDRSVFAVVNVINGDSIQFTYELTFPSGS